MRYRGRIISVILVLLVHTAIATYVAITEGKVNIVSILGYPIWFLIGYWIGKKHDEATYYSEKDPLTNLFNRRYVLNTFEKTIALSKRLKNNCFIMMIDCDNFKEINDTYNHYVGDIVLRNIGEILLRHTRKSDLASRWGGDEFLVIGLLKDGETLVSYIERIEEVFSMDLFIGEDIPVSVSVGAAMYPIDHTDLDELIKIADKNMFARKLSKTAKRQSPNQIK